MFEQKCTKCVSAFILPLLIAGCGGGSSVNSNPPPVQNPGFTVTISPVSASVAQGGTNSAAITVTAANGFTAAVNVAVGGLPTGVTISPTSPIAVSPGTPVMVTFTAAANATTGNATVTFTGTSGSLPSQSATLMLTVTAPQAADFQLIPNPATGFSVTSGSSSTLKVTASEASGATGSTNYMVTFSAASTTSGVKFAFSPASAQLGTAVTLTVTVPRHAAVVFSPLSITVTGTSGNVTHTAVVSGSVVIGGGTLDNVVFDPNSNVPAADKAAIAQGSCMPRRRLQHLLGGMFVRTEQPT